MNAMKRSRTSVEPEQVTLTVTPEEPRVMEGKDGKPITINPPLANSVQVGGKTVRLVSCGQQNCNGTVSKTATLVIE